jgi:hypothetical protein
MNEMWRSFKIREITRMTRGTSATEKTPPGQYPLVVTAEQPRSSATFQFDSEAVCVPTISSTGHGHASLKRVHYASGKFALANLLVALQVTEPEIVTARFLWLLLDTRRSNIIVPLMRGTANVSFKPEWLADVTISIPPLEEQRRIVDLIEAVDQAIRAGLDVRRQAYACQGALGESCWQFGQSAALGHLGTTLTGRTPPTNKEEYWVQPSVPFVTPGDVGQDLFIDHTVREVSEKGADYARRLPSGTVVHVCIGATIGKVGVLTRAASCNQQINALVGLDQLDAAFVGTVLGAPSGVSRTRGAAGRTTLPLLKKSSWMQLEIPWPDQTDRRETVELAQVLEDVSVGASRVVERLQRLRKELLSDLLSGNHEILASYDKLI